MFAVFNKKDRKYIAVDLTSGGYPYSTDIYNCKFWPTYEGALRYLSVLKDDSLEIHELEVRRVK